MMRCQAITRAGHQCTRNGTLGLSGKFGCWQHGHAMTLEDFSERVLRPKLAQLVEAVEIELDGVPFDERTS